MTVFAGDLNGAGLKVGIVAGRFNRAITERLLAGALERLEHLGVDPQDVDVLWVPGAFELPQGIRALGESGRYDGLLALGCVIRGETPHFEHVCRAAVQGLAHWSATGDVPLAFGLLTCDTAEQAAVRAGLKSNKGAEAAQSLVALVRALAQARA